MKNLNKYIWFIGLAVGPAIMVMGQAPETPQNPAAPPPVRAVEPSAAAPAPDRAAERPPATAPGPASAESEGGLRLNFRGVPVDMVLDYLSDAAGFIINIKPGTDLKGKVDVWSNQPLTRDEAFELLNAVLNENGLAAIHQGRTLRIMSREQAKKEDVPVKSGSDPEGIPKTDEIVTQIIPVRYINAVQLIRDLQPLLPEKSVLAANEGGNALVITDSQSNIRRLAQIVNALDTAIASVSTVRVFPLKFADATALATVIREVFQTPESSGRDLRAAILNRFRGGGPGGPFGGGGDNGGGSRGAGNGDSGGRPGASRVVATADERTNSLVVSAPDELIPTIEEVVNAVDANVEDVTELRVFHLTHSDPVEMADLLTELFPDTSRQDENRGQVRFGGGFGDPFSGGGRRGNAASDQSERLKKQGRVMAVPDRRTSSIVISAARDLMGQIEQMIAQLDASPARKQKVFVYPLENADVQNVEEVLKTLFETQNTRTTGANSRQTTNPLNNRNTANQNQGIGTGSGSNSGIGGQRGQNPR